MDSISSLYSDGVDLDMKMLKRKSMTLDFNSSSAKKQKNISSVLGSPDLNMLKLGSPELEKMIIQTNGLVTTTPTPTQFVFPKYVTEEQEAYARGFVDALAELQRSGALGSNRSQELTRTLTTLTLPTVISQSETVSTTLSAFSVASELSTTESLSEVHASRIPTTVQPTKEALPASRTNNMSTAGLEVRIPHIKDEPQTVPCLSSSPPLSPIDMESQERIKLERKRARNRMAARKCRTRKLERISRLEIRVKELKGQNCDLVTTASGLRDQVVKLKQKIVEHVSCGCQLMMPMMHDVEY